MIQILLAVEERAKEIDHAAKLAGKSRREKAGSNRFKLRSRCVRMLCLLRVRVRAGDDLMKVNLLFVLLSFVLGAMVQSMSVDSCESLC